MEKTPHEGKYNHFGGMTCFCDIISQNITNRTFTVRTIAPPGSPLRDLYIENVCPLTLHSNSNGDEVFSVVRKGSRGVLLFVETQPFLTGVFTPSLQTAPTGDLPNRVLAAEGDLIMANGFGNRIVVRNFGLIEIQATDQLKTFYNPERDVLESYCQNYHLESNGGLVDWNTDDSALTTKLEAVIQDGLNPARIIDFQGGTVDSNTILSLQTGAPDSNLNIPSTDFSLVVLNSGETTIKIKETITLNLKDSGDASWNMSSNLHVETSGSAILNMGSGKVAIGAGAVEVLQQISDELQKISTWAKTIGATHTHIGNLGYDTLPPDQASDYIQLSSDLDTIKGKIDSIKGSL